MQGMVNRIGVVFSVFLVSACYFYRYSMGGEVGLGWAIGGSFGGLALVLVMCFNPPTSTILAPLYAVLEGIVIGWISAKYEAQYNGVVFQASAITIGTFAAILVLYTLRILQATPAFTKFLLVAMVGILITYLLDFGLAVFAEKRVPYLHEGGWIGIGISLFIIVIAALNFIIDFDTIEKSVRMGAPKYMGWYCGMGLLVTLVWVYLEVLKLLAKARSSK